MSDMAHEPPDFKDMGEEALWNLINDNRHSLCLGVRPCVIIPYLRQARVLSDLDQDEILSCLKFDNYSMRTSHMLDLLRIQGCNGAVALLEGLMIHYPALYTKVTGRKPSTEPSRFSGLIKYSELTEYLVRAVTGMQKELLEERQEVAQLRSKCGNLQSELVRVKQKLEEQKNLQTEQTRLRKSHADMHRDLLKLKDEKCDLYVRYAAAVEEKSDVNIRCRDLTLQVYQLQCELRKAHTETEFQRRRSVKRMSSVETQLHDEIITLRRQLQQAEKITPAQQDILAQDLEEARDRRSELAEELRGLQDENEALMRERNELLEEKDCLSLQVQKLTLDCEMYQQKRSVFQNQLSELQAERDRAYLSRDEAQAQIACSLAEKDTLRAQLVELQEEIFTLRAQKTQRGSSQSSVSSLSLDSGRELSCDSPPSSPMYRHPLCRMNALLPGSPTGFEFNKQYSDDGFNSNRSSLAAPPCSESLRRREMDLEFSDHSPESDESYCLLNLDNDSELLCKDFSGKSEESPSPDSPETTSVSRASAPPFLVRSRPQAVRIIGRALTLSFQGEALLSQLQVIGGNKTGVFIHNVTPGSSAHSVGISSGSQILEVQFQTEQRALRMHLEDSTMEEALWALGQVNGPCSLSLRPKQDAYQNLLHELKIREVTSGDSFYVRVNMSLKGGGAEMLSVSCNDILHVTDSHYGSEGYWWASHVHSCQLMDLKSGCVPNFYRAQSQLIRAIEDLSFQQAPRRVERAQVRQRAVRIVSTAQQGRNPMWVSVEEDNTNSSKDEGKHTSMSLMPYTLVTPHYPPVCRPVLLLPTILKGILHKRLAEQKGYQLCEPETLSDAEHTVRMQKGEILEECEPNTHRCYTVQGVEKIMKRGTHCVLPLGLDCVRRLHRAEIFPIIIFIASTERSAGRLKRRQKNITESQLLECSRNEEPLLDKLPCLYRTVPPENWDKTTSLLDNLQHIVQEEQRKIVWVEPDLW